MAYQYHYAAADAGVLDYYHPHQIYGRQLFNTDHHTMSFPAPYAAAAQPPTQPNLFQHPYIYCEESFFYNYPPDFATSATHGGAEPTLLHHYPNFIQETTVFNNLPPMHGGVDYPAYDDEVMILDGDLLFPIAGDGEDPVDPLPRQDDGLPEGVVAEFLKKMTCEDGGEPELCAVCQDDLCRDNDEKIVTLKCRHRFHGDCVGKWLQMKNSCPLCKAIAIDDYY